MASTRTLEREMQHRLSRVRFVEPHDRARSADPSPSPSFIDLQHQKHRLRARKRRDKTGYQAHDFHRHCISFITRNTWALPLLTILTTVLLYVLKPGESNAFHKFLFVSHPTAAFDDTRGSIQYDKGINDIAFVLFYTVVLTFTREFIMQKFLYPIALHYGIKSRGKQARFMEQMYTAIYFFFVGPFGLYVMRYHATPTWYFNTYGMYSSFPNKTHDGVFKFYYLFQAAYWLQQAIVLVLGMEKPRKDFKELIAHHIVTLALIGLSWRFHFGYLGVAVYVTHDISDFFLAVSKSLHYMNSPLLVPHFFLFVGIWVYLRHYLNLRILYSVLTEFRTVGPYQIDWENEQYKGQLSNLITFVLLASLQLLNIIWLFCVLRSVYGIVVQKVAKDGRSESESETEQLAKALKKGQ